MQRDHSFTVRSFKRRQGCNPSDTTEDQNFLASRRRLFSRRGALGAFCSSAVALGLISFSAGSLWVEPAEAKSCGGVSLPDTVDKNGKTLRLNGIGIREWGFIKLDLYVAGLYVERTSNDPKVLLKSDQIRQMSLRLVRDIDAQKMNNALDNGFKKNAPSRYESLKPRIERFRAAVPDLKSGQLIEITMIPGKGTELAVQGKVKVMIEGDDFAESLLAIWLGPSPPNAGLKKGLLGGPC
ncbi:MAG: chalcone isomerase family protein [Polyangiaceae bacterium]|nr:chalcone isomerase family protein [Polyangiaceae bacterium]